ncbi:MAG TPA: cyclic nucleotide-binding domain-containing protein [Chthoniobacterales bacterium]|nr:cyclic nucleotide-binding domain-containing protein [Chthoniobacterales bacterium]
MAEEPVRISKPQRWDIPFGEDMTEARVERLMQQAPFNRIDESKFPSSAPLRGIFLNDARLRRFEDGDIVVREGDYGSSAFFIVSGAVQVILDSLPAQMLGRRVSEKKNFFKSVAQLWERPSYPEVRDYSQRKVTGTATAEVRARGDEKTSEVRIFLQDVPRVLSENHTARLEAGELFGEIAALGRAPRTATVIAEGRATLLEIRWQGLREIRRYAPEWKARLDQLYRERSLDKHLRATPFLNNLEPGAFRQVFNTTRFETYGDFEWQASYHTGQDDALEGRLAKEPLIFREGDYPDGMVLIRSGFARVSRQYNHGERTLRYLGKGQFIGLEEIASSWKSDKVVPLQNTLRAIGYVDLLVIPTAIVQQHILPQLSAEELQALECKPSAEPAVDLEEEISIKLGPDMLEFLVDNRTINGTATMLIDLDRCTRCDDCVRACASAHNNNPRFIRHGREMNGIMVANACMHCVDPVCMIGCPTGAIHRESFQGQVVINDDTCIGCATCANSCPYDNIQMVETRDHSGFFILDEVARTPIMKATKCDLCIDQLGGPACARACPHDALIRLDMRDVDKLATWINR